MYISIIPATVAGVFGGLILLVAMLYSMRSAKIVLGVMFFLASISITLAYDESVYRTWLLPIQRYRAELFGVCGVVLLVGLLPRMRYLSMRQITGHAWIFVAMGIYAGLLRMYHVSPTDGLISLLFALATIIPLSLGLAALLREDEDTHRIMSALVWATVVWILAVAVQFVINRKLIVLGLNNRFTGLIGNCNVAATMLSVVATCSLWLSLNGRPAARLFYAMATGVFVLLIIWTGSRGGAGMFVIGMAAVLYGRAGRAVLFLPIIAGFLFLALKIAGAANIEVSPDRLTSLTNTRAGAWASLFQTGLSYPVFGHGPEDIEGSENSLLLGFASYGAGMLLIILILIGASIVQCFKLWNIRRYATRDDAALIDLVLGQHAMYLAGSIFEGYMNARINSNLVMILVAAAFGRFIIARYNAPALDEYAYATDEDDQPADGYGDEPYNDPESAGLRPEGA